MSALYILDSNGRILIHFDYRGEVDLSVPDKFMAYIQGTDKIQPLPVFRVDDWCFCHVVRSSLYFFMVTRSNSNISVLLVFLDALAKLLHDYLHELTADAIIDNFTLIYELLDEVMDYGHPQILDFQALSSFILREQPRDIKDQPKVPVQITALIPWRAAGIDYNVNEVYVDVVEYVHVLVGTHGGSVIQNEVDGEINMTSQLSGMPEVRIGLNDQIIFNPRAEAQRWADISRRLFEVEDIKFHQCVNIAQFERDRSITFIPPDGTFNLLKYRLTSCMKPIIEVESTFEKYQGSRVELTITARSQFQAQSVARNVKIMVPVPSDVDSPKAQCSAGSMRYYPKDNCLVWSIKQFPGKKMFSLRAHFGLPSVESEEAEAKRPIHVEFEIPYFTVSGLRVSFLKVLEKSNYEAISWVRYLTLNGSYEFRT
jgi:AP-1 complex subunit mu